MLQVPSTWTFTTELTRKCYLCGMPGHLTKECCLGNSKGVPQLLWGQAVSPSNVANVVVVATV